jgi:hypothetical protein
MGNGETTSSSVRSDVSEGASQLAQDGGEASRLPRAPQLVMVPTQGAGPVAIEIQPAQPAAAPPVRQPQVAPAVQHPQPVPNIRQAAPPPVPRPPVAPTFRQPPAAPAVQQPQATPNIRQSQVAPEVRQSVQPPPPPPVQQPQAGANLRQSQITPEMRESQISPEMRQSRSNSNAQLAWIASDVRPSQADPVDYDAQPPEPEAEPIRSMTRRDIGHDSGRAPIGLVPKILGTAAVVGVGVVAAWVLGTVVFPNAPKDEVRDRNLSILAPAPEDASAQQAPPADNPQTTDNSQAADNSQPADNSQSTAASVLAPAPGALVVATPEPQPQQQSAQQQPQVQALNEQPQPQQRLSEQQITSPQQVGNDQAQSPPSQQKSEISLSPQEVDRLTNLGEKMLAQGDVSTARRLLEHAAEARGARAALLLGATYDPEGLRKMGVLGMRPDVDKAHMWYTRAAQYGSTEASRRLAGLGQRGH